MSDAMHTTATALVAPGKGILAADESTGTIKKRFDTIGVDNTEDHRQAYREMLFTTPALGESISGVILFDETIHQSTGDGVSFEGAGRRRLIPGIKVDTAKPRVVPNETVTEGLDGLRSGCHLPRARRSFREGGPRSSVPARPPIFAIDANAHAMARCARRPTSSRSSSPRS
jgi:fructose-bisphosphate aldolase class I